jgi:hypothetical protein
MFDRAPLEEAEPELKKSPAKWTLNHKYDEAEYGVILF